MYVIKISRAELQRSERSRNNRCDIFSSLVWEETAVFLLSSSSFFLVPSSYDETVIFDIVGSGQKREDIHG